MIKRQTTINRIFRIAGIGLHTGQEVTLEFLPRREFGIAFMFNGRLIRARYDMVAETRLSTQIAADGVQGGHTRLFRRDGRGHDVTPSKGDALFFRHGFGPGSVGHVGMPVGPGTPKYVARINVMYDFG